MTIFDYLNQRHDKSATEAMIRLIGNDVSRFKELMTYLFGKDKLLAQRAAWPFSYIAIDYPELVSPYFEKLIKKLKEQGNHPAIQRNILRAFQEIEIPEKYQSDLLDICFQFIKSEMHPLAVRAFSITVAARICKPYVELRKELLMVLKDLMTHPQAPAINVRIKYALKELKAVDSKI